jgi:xanthine dehydrogenase large subunit
MAIPGEGEDMFVHSSTQHPSEVQHICARVLGVADHCVTVECRRMGGGFGGKETQASHWAALAAFAARITGRACKLRLDRDDDFVLTGKRHDFISRYDVGYDDDGRLAGASIEHLARCGYSADLSLGVVDRTMFHTDNAYFLPASRIASRRLKTHTVSNTAFRGFGGPQGMLVIERVMDAIAHKTGRDPLDIRKANFYTPGRDITPYGMHVFDCGTLPPLVEALEASSRYRARRAEIVEHNARSRILKRGIALNPVKFGISFTLKHLNQAGALVHVYSDGSVMLNHGGTEMGQGLYVKVAQVVADEFGIPLDRVKITATNTAKVPNTSPTAASAGSDLNGMAAKAAARQIRDRMAAEAARRLGGDATAIRFAHGRVIAADSSMTFNELAKTCYLERVSLSSTGYYATPGITWDRNAKTGNPFFYFAYGAACSEVIIDTMTGEMKVLAVDILHDCGKSLNPAIDIGQIEGGFVQGMGWLTTEELVYDAQGRLRTHAPSTYKIPVASDVPAHFRVDLWHEANRAEAIHRSKAVGEPPLMLAISVFSAICDAIHGLNPGNPVQLRAPATPEAILDAVDHQLGRSL